MEFSVEEIEVKELNKINTEVLHIVSFRDDSVLEDTTKEEDNLYRSFRNIRKRNGSVCSFET